MNWRRALLLPAALGALALAACGDDDSSSQGTDRIASVTQTESSPPQDLSPAGMRVIQQARDAVSAHCRQVAEALAKGTAPPTATFERATAAVEELARLAAEQPEAEAEDGATPRLALGDIAENLEGTNCDARLVARINEALAALPAE